MITISTIGTTEYLKGNLPAAFFAYEGGALAASGPLSPAERKEISRIAGQDAFKGKPGECFMLKFTFRGSTRSIVLVGLGKKAESDSETLRKASASLFQFAKGRWSTIAVTAPSVGPAVEGLCLASYRFEEYKKEDPDKLTSASLLLASAGARKKTEAQIEKAVSYVEAVCLCRDLVNRGPSDKTPKSLGAIAQKLPGIKVTIIDKKQAQKMGMGSFLGVARGSSVDPIMLHMVYKPKGAKKKIGLVGKGITFDSGGLSLKPPASMETMKCDMAGAATVIGVFKSISRLKIKVEVHGVCPITYNMPGPDALKPGDVLKAMNGKTIEVLNTDAEGRLALADALVYTNRQKVDSMIDLATLTGACVVALGSKVTGAMTNNKALLSRIFAAGKRADEYLCELPLLKEYKDQIKSSIADLQNIGKVRGEAGAITAGLFLEEFVDKTPWVHLDIAGTAWSDGPTAYGPRGGTGGAVRTILEFLGAL